MQVSLYKTDGFISAIKIAINRKQLKKGMKTGEKNYSKAQTTKLTNMQ